MTDQKYVRLYNKKNMPLSQMKDNLLDYLVGAVRNEMANVFRSDGVFDAAAVVAPSGINNAVDIGDALGFRGVDGQGKTIKVGAADARLHRVRIPPDAGVHYHIGLQQYDVDSGVEINPRTGEVEYSYFEELLGKLAVPTSLLDNGNGTLTFTLDTLMEAGKDHTGRNVRVWLKSRTDGGIGPLSSVLGTAIETCGVVVSGGHNKITTAAKFGQTVASTTAADYRVMLIGPTVTRLGAQDLRSASGVLFLADVLSVATANPIVTVSTVDQTVIPPYSQQAVDLLYAGGPNWLDGTTNPGASVEAQLDKLITDLVDVDGAERIGSDVSGNLPAGSIRSQLDALLAGAHAGIYRSIAPAAAGIYGDPVLTSDGQIDGATDNTGAIIPIPISLGERVQAVVVYGQDANGGGKVFTARLRKVAMNTNTPTWESNLFTSAASGALQICSLTGITPAVVGADERWEVVWRIAVSTGTRSLIGVLVAIDAPG